MIGYRSTILCLTVLVFNASLAFSQKRQRDKILAKRDFTITIEYPEGKPKGAEGPIETMLSFRSDKAWCQHLQGQDNGAFIRGNYAVLKKEKSDSGTTYFFQAINKNQKKMSLKWEGEVFKDQISGTGTISKKGKVKQQFSFTGTEKY